MKWIARLAVLNRLERTEHRIGHKLSFREIPELWINGLMTCDMTRTWQQFGLKISDGANYFTVGSIKDGVSSRFSPAESQYQSWLGGYTVKLGEARRWTLQDHLNLAVADQMSWLKRYGDPRPFCDMRESDFRIVASIQAGGYSGTLYEGGCKTHSDVGKGYSGIWLRLSAAVVAAVFNMSNPALHLRGAMLRPRCKGASYESLRLKGYVAIFDVDENVKVVLYGNGIAAGDDTNIDTFETLKSTIRRAFEKVEIVSFDIINR